MDSKYTGAEVEARLDEVNQLSLKVEALEQGGVGGLRKLKILVIGNSYSRDSFMYAPFILKNYGINIELGIYYRGGASLANHVSEWNTASNSFDYIDTETLQAWSQTRSNFSPKMAVEYKDWDIITLQQGSVDSVSESTFEPATRNLVKLINASRVGKPYKLAWNINHNRKSSGSDYDAVAKTILTNIKATIDREPIGLLFPYGTSIFIARKDSNIGNLGGGGYLWASDNVHLNEGLPCYIAALANVEALFRVYYPHLSVMGDITRPTQTNITAWGVKEQNGTSVGVTDDNCFLAQIYAVNANNNPWMGIGQSSSENTPSEPVEPEPEEPIPDADNILADATWFNGYYSNAQKTDTSNKRFVTCELIPIPTDGNYKISANPSTSRGVGFRPYTATSASGENFMRSDLVYGTEASKNKVDITTDELKTLMYSGSTYFSICVWITASPSSSTKIDTGEITTANVMNYISIEKVYEQDAPSEPEEPADFWESHPLVMGYVYTSTPYLDQTTKAGMYVTFESSIPFSEGIYHITMASGWKFRWNTTEHLSPDNNYAPAARMRRFSSETTGSEIAMVTSYAQGYANEGQTDWILNFTRTDEVTITIDDVKAAFTFEKVG